VDTPTAPLRGVSIDCRILGPLEIRADGRPVNLGGAQRRAVMAVLLNAAGDAVSEDVLIESLWGEQSGAAARNNVQSHVSRLRAALGASGVDGPAEFVRRTPRGYRVELEQADLDSDWVRTALSRARTQREHDPRGAASRLERALSLWRGRPFEEFADLPGWGVSGLAAAQAGLDELRTTIREEHFETRLAIGEHADILPQLEQATMEEPLRERLHRLLAVALYRSDRPTDALGVLRGFRARLAEESGLDASADLERVEHAILQQDSALARPTVMPARTVVPPGASPAGATRTLIGREHEVARLLTALDDSRLVTITGPGGVGKSRLATATADVLADEAASSTRDIELFELAAIHDGAAFTAAVAQRLGVRAGPDVELDRALVDYLAGRQLLLVLDNCEHLLGEVGAFVQRVLDTAPRVIVLVTSRERLGLPTEQLAPLGPLTVATKIDRPAAVPQDAPLSPAGELFVARARRTRPDFPMHREDRVLVEELCRRLDGLPLAIELAASQLSALGLRDLHDALDDRLDVLALSRRTTLRGVIDRSYDLLDDHEQQLFEQLAVFDGGFTLDAVHAIARAVEDAPATTRRLTRLVDASLVTVADGRHGRVRYSLLETLRLYADERLQARGGREQVVERHGSWVVDLAETAEVALEGPDERDWSERLAVEFPNIRGAWHAAIGRGDVTTAARITVALACFAQMHGQAELWTWTRRLVSEEGLAGHPLESAVHGAAAQACYLQGDLGAAEDHITAGVAAGSSGGTPDRAWWCTAAANIVALFRGEHAESERLAAEALEQADDSPVWRTILAGDIVLARLYAGKVDRARDAVGRCVRLAAASGSPTALAWSHYVDGEVALVDDPVHAVKLLGEAVDLARTVGATFVEGVAMVSLFSAAVRADNHQRALEAVPQVIGHWQRLGGMWVQQWTTLRILVELLVTLGLLDEAAVLLAAADTDENDAPEVTGADAEREDALRTTIRTRLGARAYDRSRLHGERLTRPQVVAYALGTALPNARQVAHDIE
jgi:predicted ATPase/DNA-binding SARP family transcriptional activator